MTGEGVPVDSGAGYNSKYPPRKIMNFNGQGDFLTVVTHLRNYHDERLIYSIDKKDYGAELIFPQIREEVFNDQARIYVDEKEFSFDGYVGYLTDTHLQKRLAIFNGSYIRLDDFSLTIPFDREIRYGMSAVLSENEVRGNAVFGAEGEVFVRVSRLDKAKVFVDHKAVDFSYKKGAYCFIMPRGKHSYNIGETPDIEKAAVRFTVARKDGFDVKWEHLLGAQTYEISLSADDEYTYRTVGTVQAKEGENSFAVNDLKKGKFYVRVRGINGKKFGEFSHAYPVYVTDALPHSPEGFRVEKTAQGDYCASWGEVLGCGVYKLYKVEDGETRLFYEGGDRKISVPQGMYYVTSVNGNGESMPSLSRSTWDERAAWDNRPEKGFVRDTRSHEHGYSGFDYINNKLKPILRYPEKENQDV